ncbi:unnamed protein product, partial [Rotaria magnacalcarata]
MRHSRNVFITRHLELLVKNCESRETQFRYFLRYFPIDNLFTLRIIGANANSIIVAEILDELFNRKLRDGSD